ncbi:MAG: DUF6778 family protein [Pseudomonadota bacterium]
MFDRRIRGSWIALGLAVVVTAGCVGPRASPTDFSAGVAQEQSTVSNWAFGGASVSIRPDMIVSDEPDRRYPPSDQLVWYGDPPGDRKAQVIALVQDAVTAGAVDALSGGETVTLRINVTQFHAMTPRARRSILPLGVHEVEFDLEVVDAAGAVIASESGVRADLEAFSGDEAAVADRVGQGQKIRIQSRIAQVVRSWLTDYRA